MGRTRIRRDMLIIRHGRTRRRTEKQVVHRARRAFGGWCFEMQECLVEVPRNGQASYATSRCWCTGRMPRWYSSVIRVTCYVGLCVGRYGVDLILPCSSVFIHDIEG
jgi:hypothetical protein